MRINNISGFFQKLANKELHRHPLATPLWTVAVLSIVALIGLVFAGGSTIGATDSHLVRLSTEGNQQVIPTRAVDVKEFLERTKTVINQGDVVEPSLDTKILSDDFRVNVYRARPVAIFDDGNRVQTVSAASEPRTVVEQAGLKIYPEDIVKQNVASNVVKEQVIGEKITIDRASVVNINVYGTPTVVRTQAKTVAELLAEKGIKANQDDQVSPAADTPLDATSEIFITRNGTKVETSEESIPMETTYVEDANLTFGATAVRQAGSNGKKLVTYEIVLKNDKEVSRKVIQEVRVSEPVAQIVARGKAFNISTDKTEVMAAAGISPSDYPYVDYIIRHESGWRPLAANASSGAYGLCQALPGSKMASAGADWATNPVTQLRWCSSYAAGKGGWAASYNLWVTQHWW